MTPGPAAPGDPDAPGFWLDDPAHRAFLVADARAQLAFFRPSLVPGGRVAALDRAGAPIPGAPQALHATARLVHAYALAGIAGDAFAAPRVDAALEAIDAHRDRLHGGWLWTVRDGIALNGPKVAYGQVFVLLAAATATMAGQAGARSLLDEAAAVIEARFWDEDAGLLRDDLAQDWRAVSTYRGLNANMHGAEAMLAAYEATGTRLWLERAGRILAFFALRMAPAHGWRLPEHYRADWSVDAGYAGDPMFRPAGTTPGHALETARLLLQHWNLAGRPATGAPEAARRLVTRALSDGWRAGGGLAYTLRVDGAVDVADRYWWPVAEGIAATAALVALDRREEDEAWYRRLWSFAALHFIDRERGGWMPEIDEAGRPVERQFQGKPDIYHALQACLLPLAGTLSGTARRLREAAPLA